MRAARVSHLRCCLKHTYTLKVKVHFAKDGKFLSVLIFYVIIFKIETGFSLTPCLYEKKIIKTGIKQHQDSKTG